MDKIEPAKIRLHQRKFLVAIYALVFFFVLCANFFVNSKSSLQKILHVKLSYLLIILCKKYFLCSFRLRKVRRDQRKLAENSVSLGDVAKVRLTGSSIGIYKKFD